MTPVSPSERRASRSANLSSVSTTTTPTSGRARQKATAVSTTLAHLVPAGSRRFERMKTRSSWSPKRSTFSSTVAGGSSVRSRIDVVVAGSPMKCLFTGQRSQQAVDEGGLADLGQSGDDDERAACGEVVDEPGGVVVAAAEEL